MALETANTINQLVESNPLGTDTKSQGDDHIRLIKKTLRNTFPNLTGPITVTEAVINGLGTGKNLTFPGMIVMWSGSTVPSGWLLCNGTGTLSNGQAVPDLRGKFVVGAGGGTSVGDTGGALTHTHLGTVGDTTLTIEQLPPHKHTLSNKATTFDGGSSGHSAVVPDYSVGARPSENKSTSTVGEGLPHSHSLSFEYSDNLPPYYSLAFIIKE